jgi:hypothetical protein
VSSSREGICDGVNELWELWGVVREFFLDGICLDPSV